MNIYLLRSNELHTETYWNVFNLLEQFNGPMKFIACEENLIESNSEEVTRIWENKEDFEKLKKTTKVSHDILMSEDSISFPYIEKVKTWNQLFAECDNYRKYKNLPDEDIVVLLTDIGNDRNWFGGVSESMNNYFVQTSNWDYFLGNTIDIRFPIAYEVIVWVMRFYMFANNEAIWDGVHNQPIGCIMDFCKDKSQIILKMRTADVCESCMNTFIERDIPTLYSRQFFNILDGIRNSMTFRGRATLLQQPSRIEIKSYTKKIFFTDLGGLELRLNPKEKAIYLFFLNHPNGIQISHLSDYEKELTNLYSSVTNQTELEVITRAIKILVNPLENDINVVLSRINKKIKDAVGESLSEFYCIKGARGEKKRISIDREMVIIKE